MSASCNGDGTEAACGDGFFNWEAGEQCEAAWDGAAGCADCGVVDGWQCLPAAVDATTGGGACTPVCGDGLIIADEGCDDGNTKDGDGCSAFCRVERDWVCEQPGPGLPSVCSRATFNRLSRSAGISSMLVLSAVLSLVLAFKKKLRRDKSVWMDSNPFSLRSYSNWFAIVSPFVDVLQLSALSVVPTVRWDPDVRAMTVLRQTLPWATGVFPNVPWQVTFVISMAMASSFVGGYALTQVNIMWRWKFGSKVVLRMMNLIGGILFLPVATGVLGVVACSWDDGWSMKSAPDIVCWRGQHLRLAGFAVAIIMLYFPLAVRLAPLWQRLFRRLQIHERSSFLILSPLPKLIVVVVTNFTPDSRKRLHHAVVAVAIGSLLLLSIGQYPVSNRRIMSVLRPASLIGPFALAVAAIVLDMDVNASTRSAITSACILLLAVQIAAMAVYIMVESAASGSWKPVAHPSSGVMQDGIQSTLRPGTNGELDEADADRDAVAGKLEKPNARRSQNRMNAILQSNREQKKERAPRGDDEKPTVSFSTRVVKRAGRLSRRGNGKVGKQVGVGKEVEMKSDSLRSRERSSSRGDAGSNSVRRSLGAKRGSNASQAALLAKKARSASSDSKKSERPTGRKGAPGSSSRLLSTSPDRRLSKGRRKEDGSPLGRSRKASSASSRSGRPASDGRPRNESSASKRSRKGSSRAPKSSERKRKPSKLDLSAPSNGGLSPLMSPLTDPGLSPPSSGGF